MDKATLGGLFLAIGGILLGLMLEGGNLGQVLQPTAAMIVFGGTLGAVLIQYPLPVAMSAFRRLAQVFVEPAQNAQSTIELLVKYANQARREGIISLDKELATIPDPFLRRALMLAVDGTDPQELRNTMELELDNKEEQEEKIRTRFDPGYATPGQNRRSWKRYCRRVRGYSLRSWRRQPHFAACSGKTKDSHPRRADHPRNDARGCRFHPRGNEPSRAGRKAAGVPHRSPQTHRRR